MASTYLTRTPSSTGNQKTWTMSFWMKPSKTETWYGIYGAWGASTASDITKIEVFNDSKLNFIDFQSSALTAYLVTTQVFRDTSAWYHIVVAVDTTQATASNRIKLYVNGSQITSFDTETYPTQNLDMNVNSSSFINRLGLTYNTGGTDAKYFDGSLAHFHLTDGTAYDADTFGETDATTGIWKPKTAPSVTYGTNGFFLKFENSGAFGTDSSGNSNTFTVNGTMTQTIDTPSNVFCTLNPLAVNPSSGASTLSNGNTSVNNAGSSRCFGSTLAVSKGKYYWEYKMIDLGDIVGARSIDEVASGANLFLTSKSFGVYYGGDSTLYINGSSQGNIGTSTDTANDIAMFALDCDNNKIYLGLNGNWTTGIGNGYDTSTFASANGFTIDSNILWTVDMTNGSSSTAHDGAFNFGNGFFGTTAVSSAQNPDDGIGIFEYDVPTGYRALCTKSINAEEYS